VEGRKTEIVNRNLDPPFGGGTHSPLALPDRNLLVLADETNFANCSLGLRHIWLFDVREPTNPVSFATMPVPSERHRDHRLPNGGALEQEMAAHESPRTTKLYDRTKERLTQDEVERIRL
jgi:hypothetical protein